MALQNIMALAEAKGLHLTEEQAKGWLTANQSGELSDHELEAVAGGKDQRRVTVINRRTIINRIFVRH